MTLEDRLTIIERWANHNRIDCQLSGAYEQADHFDAVEQLTRIVRTQASLIQTLEELKRTHEAEIARLESLAHRS